MNKPSLPLMAHAKARHLLREINQFFTDTTDWNAHAWKTGGEIIDPDPNGELRQLAASLENFLKEKV